MYELAKICTSELKIVTDHRDTWFIRQGRNWRSLHTCRLLYILTNVLGHLCVHLFWKVKYNKASVFVC